MSENWGHFFSQIGDHRASFIFDDGISGEIDSLKHLQSVWLQIPLREWNDQDLTNDDEATRQNAMEERIEAALNSAGGIILGRVTYDRTRHVMALAPDASIKSSIQKIFSECGYDCEITIKPDPEQSIYWRDLYPTDDDRQVMNDLLVLKNLREHGDNLQAERRVDHWTYFDEEDKAKAFENWAKLAGYDEVEIARDQDDDGAFCVRSAHNSTMIVDDITRHTLALSRKATELGGNYDGWETLIIKSD